MFALSLAKWRLTERVTAVKRDQDDGRKGKSSVTETGGMDLSVVEAHVARRGDMIVVRLSATLDS